MMPSPNRMPAYTPARKLTLCALLCVGALVLGFAESLLPLPIPIPGVKLGLGNVFVLLALYLFTWREASLVLAGKVMLSSLLYAGFGALPYAVAGGTLALVGMAALAGRKDISPIGCSAAGAALHGLGQVALGAWITATPTLFVYATPLMLLGLVSGGLTGLAVLLCLRRLRPDALHR